MKYNLYAFIAVILLGVGTPLLNLPDASRLTATLTLIFASVIYSIWTGYAWHGSRTIQDSNSQNCLDELASVEKNIMTSKYALRIFTPSSTQALSLDWKSKKPSELIAQIYLSPIIFGTAILSLAGLLLGVMFQYSGRGVFGSLLQLPIGRSIVTGFAVFLLANSCSILMVGVFAKFDRKGL